MLEFTPLFEIRANVAAAQVTADGPYGTRRFIPINGGSFSGDRLEGRVLPGGADCQLIRPDGVAELDVRVALQTADGVVLLMKGVGMRHGPAEVLARLAHGERVDPREYYFRETMMFEAPRGPYDWLNRLIAVGTGQRQADQVVIQIFQLH